MYSQELHPMQLSPYDTKSLIFSFIYSVKKKADNCHVPNKAQGNLQLISFSPGFAGQMFHVKHKSSTFQKLSQKRHCQKQRKTNHLFSEIFSRKAFDPLCGVQWDLLFSGKLEISVGTNPSFSNQSEVCVVKRKMLLA